MVQICPFYKDMSVPPCLSCQFACKAGCAIQLAGYAYDALKEGREVNEKIENIKYDLDEIKRKLSR